MPRVPEPAVAVSYTLGFAASRLRRFLLRHLQFWDRGLHLFGPYPGFQPLRGFGLGLICAALSAPEID
jgi:hypothetical protein